MRTGQPWLGDRTYRRARRLLPAALLVVWNALVLPAPAGAQGPVVRAVLFFSPTCPHCHKVINEDLPVIFQRFGGEARVYFDQDLPRDQVVYYLVSNAQVELLLINASLADGHRLYSTSQEALAIPENRRGVPRLVVRDSVLVGSSEIPQFFPSIIEEGLAKGGIDWPDIAGLQEAVATFPFLQPLAGAEELGVPAADDATSEAGANPGREVAAEAETEPSRDVAEEAAADTGGEVAEETAMEPGREVAEERPAETPPASPTAEVEGVEPSTAEAEAMTGADSNSDRSADLAPDSAAAGHVAEAPSTDLGVIAERRASMAELYQRDPVGNSFSVLVLLGMLVSLVAVYNLSQRRMGVSGEPSLVVPFLALIGIFVAGYLAYIESTGAEAVCGPVGDCNTVNQSEYAVLLGVPVGVLGLVGYAAIIAAWLTARSGRGAASDWAKVVLLGMTLVGTLFSVYLTFLEPFVIGATCAWCLTSAAVMTLLMLLAARPALGAIERLRAA